MVKEILERGSEQINYQDVVQAFLAEVVDIGDTSCDSLLAVELAMRWVGRCELTAANEDLVRSVLIPQLRSIAFPGFLRLSIDVSSRLLATLQIEKHIQT